MFDIKFQEPLIALQCSMSTNFELKVKSVIRIYLVNLNANTFPRKNLEIQNS